MPAPQQRDWVTRLWQAESPSPETSLRYKSTCRQRRFYKDSGRSTVVLLVARRYQELDTVRVVPSGPSVTAARNGAAAPLRGPAPSVGRLGRARLNSRHKRGSGRPRPPGSPPARYCRQADRPDRPASANRRPHEVDQPEAGACPRPGRPSAWADRWEAPRDAVRRWCL